MRLQQPLKPLREDWLPPLPQDPLYPTKETTSNAISLDISV